MPKPFKIHSTRPLPKDAEIVQHQGKPHVRLKDTRGRVALFALTKDGVGYLRPSKCCYFKIADRAGVVKRIKGFADLKATEQLAAEMERREARRRVGLIAPEEEQMARPLSEHLADYGEHLRGKGDGEKHIRDTLARCRSLLEGCGFVRALDVDIARAVEWLNASRRDRLPIKPPAGDMFPPAEVSRMLGVSSTAVSALMRRHQLPATGNGKARRYPRSTVEVLLALQAKGASPETVNHRIRAVRGFFNWMVKTRRAGSNPLATLQLLNADADRRRIRRELTADELGRLFAATRQSRRIFRGLDGEDRYHLSLLAASTGLRAGALGSLRPADFDLDAGTVTLAARFNKSRRLKVQPLPTDVAAALRPYLARKPDAGLVWGGTWAKECDGGEMIRTDLKDAAIAYAVEGTNGIEYADFHALRHSFLTLGGRSGIDLRTLQELAGHSTPTLTSR